MATTDGVVSAVFEVFTEVGNWISSAFTQLQPVFYNTTDKELTIIGTMTVVGLAVAVILLIFNIIKDIFRFR